MAFRWKDRAAAVRQAAWEFQQNKTRLEAYIALITPEQLAEMRAERGPDFAPSFGREQTIKGCCHKVLGTGSYYIDRYCLDPENMPYRSFVQFQNDVIREISYRENDYSKVSLTHETASCCKA